MTTPLSNAGSYLPAAEYLKRSDQRTVARWVSDSTAAVAPAALSADPNLAAALLDASGLVESACLRSGIYQPSDLTTLTGAGQGYLYRLVAWLTTCCLWERRPAAAWKDPPPWFWERAYAELDALADGKRLFSLAEPAAAGRTAYDPVVPSDIDNQGLTRRLAGRLFGRRTQDYDKYIPGAGGPAGQCE